MGDLEMPFILSQGVGTLTHLPDRPWLNKLLQVVSMTPLGREKGSRKDRRKQTGKGIESLSVRPGAGLAERCPAE